MSLEEAMDNFTRGRRRKYGPIDLTKPPTEEELNGQTPQQREDYSLPSSCSTFFAASFARRMTTVSARMSAFCCSARPARSTGWSSTRGKSQVRSCTRRLVPGECEWSLLDIERFTKMGPKDPHRP